MERHRLITVISYIHRPPPPPLSHSMLVMSTLIAKNAVEECENQRNIEWASMGGVRGREIVVYGTDV